MLLGCEWLDGLDSLSCRSKHFLANWLESAFPVVSCCQFFPRWRYLYTRQGLLSSWPATPRLARPPPYSAPTEAPQTPAPGAWMLAPRGAPSSGAVYVRTRQTRGQLATTEQALNSWRRSTWEDNVLIWCSAVFTIEWSAYCTLNQLLHRIISISIKILSTMKN